MRRANPRKNSTIETLSLIEVSRFCRVQSDWIIALVDCGVLEPLGCHMNEWRFTPTLVLRARNARRLTHEYGLNITNVSLVLDLIEERDALARKLAQLNH